MNLSKTGKNQKNEKGEKKMINFEKLPKEKFRKYQGLTQRVKDGCPVMIGFIQDFDISNEGEPLSATCEGRLIIAGPRVFVYIEEEDFFLIRKFSSSKDALSFVLGIEDDEFIETKFFTDQSFRKIKFKNQPKPSKKNFIRSKKPVGMNVKILSRREVDHDSEILDINGVEIEVNNKVFVIKAMKNGYLDIALRDFLSNESLIIVPCDEGTILIKAEEV